MTKDLHPDKARRLRGAVLTVLCANHNRQGHRLDDVLLGGALQGLLFDISSNDVLTILQDLKDRDYVRYVQRRNWLTGRMYCEQIEITARGRDLVEENIKADPAVEF